MAKKTKDKFIVNTSLVIFVVLVFASIITSETPSYEIDSLRGYKWLLHYGIMAYLPVFPIVSAFLCFPMGLKSASEPFTINAVITLVFTLFAWVLHFQYVSWTLLLVGNFVILAMIMYFERQDQKNKK